MINPDDFSQPDLEVNHVAPVVSAVVFLPLGALGLAIYTSAFSIDLTWIGNFLGLVP